MPHVASSLPTACAVHSCGARLPRPSKCHSSGPGAQGSPGAAQRRGRPARPGGESPNTTSHKHTRSRVWQLLERRQTLDLGLLTKICPPQVVEQVLARHGMRPGRGLLPFHLTVYLVLALCLLTVDSYQEILRVFWPAWFGNQQEQQPMPNKSSLCRARMRLGEAVLASLFLAIARPLATSATPGAFWREHRIMAIDGFTVEMPDSPENEAAFGGQVDKRRRRVGLPQARVVGLVECGTHALVGAVLGRYNDGERELAAKLAPSIQADMLVLADRGFLEVRLWQAYRQAGAHLLWRIKSNVATKVVQVLEDGSYLARVSAKAGSRSAGPRPAPIVVRVIEYHVEGSQELIRLATSLLDPLTAPALELAELYTQRWECESSYDELKTHQRGPGVVLRSRIPNGVRQELWAHLILHYGARAVMVEAAMAAGQDLDPDRLSFTLTLRLVRHSLPRAPFPTNQKAALEAAIAELTAPRALVQRRPYRTHSRTVKRSRSRYPCSLATSPGARRTSPPSLTLVH